MQVGQRVVCINDTFEAWVHEYYDQLPTKGRTYQIRAVSLGRATLVGSEMAEVRLLLEELHNPSDPHHMGGEELGFRSDRFAPLEELEDNATAQAATEKQLSVSLAAAGRTRPAVTSSRR
jgi:hypothetical protein